MLEGTLVDVARFRARCAFSLDALIGGVPYESHEYLPKLTKWKNSDRNKCLVAVKNLTYCLVSRSNFVFSPKSRRRALGSSLFNNSQSFVMSVKEIHW